MRTAAFVILLMIPANLTGCASMALPMDGSLLKKVTSKDSGPACECRASKPQTVCYCGPADAFCKAP